MFEWTHTVTSTATPAQIWGLYADVDRWREGDTGLSAITLDGLFARQLGHHDGRRAASPDLDPGRGHRARLVHRRHRHPRRRHTHFHPPSSSH